MILEERERIKGGEEKSSKTKTEDGSEDDNNNMKTRRREDTKMTKQYENKSTSQDQEADSHLTPTLTLCTSRKALSEAVIFAVPRFVRLTSSDALAVFLWTAPYGEKVAPAKYKVQSEVQSTKCC